MAKREIILDVQANINEAQSDIINLTQALENNKKAISDLTKENRKKDVVDKESAKQLATLKLRQDELNREYRVAKKDLENSTKAANSAISSNNQLRAQIALLTKQYDALGKEARENTKEGRALERQIEELTDALKKNKAAIGDNRLNVGNYKSALGGLKDGLVSVAGSVLGPLGVAAAFDRLVSLGRQSVEAANIQLQAEAKLLTALKGREDIQQELIASAAEIQSRTLFGDEVIINAQAFFAAAGLGKDQIKAATEAAIQLSSATGVELDSAVKNIAKTFGGLTGELGELVPELKTLTKEQLQNGEAVTFLNNKFQGFAETAAKTGTGPLKQFQNTLGDISEEIGKVLIPALTSLLKLLQNLFGILKQTIGPALKEVSEDFSEFTRNIQAITKALGISNVEFSAFSSILKGIAFIAKSGVQAMTPLIRIFNDLADAFRAVKRLFAGGLPNPATGAAPQAPATGSALPAPVPLPRSSMPAGFMSLAEFEKQQEEKAKAAAAAEKKRIAELEKIRKEQAKKAQKEQERLAREEEKRKAEKAAKDFDHLINVANKEISLRQDLAGKIRQIDQQVTADADAQARARALVAQREFETRISIMNALANSADSVASIFREESIANKLLSSASAAINTYAGAAAALAPPPIGAGPLVGPFVAAAIIAQGLAQVARINAIQFAEGGIVRGPGTGTSDSIPARLSDGESVINAKSTAQFLPVLDYINRAGGGAPLLDGPKFRFADGGLATAAAASEVRTQVNQMAQLRRAIMDMPAPVVSVKEVARVQNRVRAKENVRKI